ncbi:MAG TPA: SAM domain-containing protein [Stellaceae bacterium]|nr:SAM domain-containing protein [Stellaceae bacterium]
MDVADWLRKLGLEQYEPAFRENEIDERVLPSLTAEDLRDLGITLVGHRRRLLDAIAALGRPFPNPPPLAGEGRVGVPGYTVLKLAGLMPTPPISPGAGRA